MTSANLSDHIAATYSSLRIGLAALAIALPFVLWFGGLYFFDLPLQGSMSAYYHACDGAMRDIFVGSLIALGAFLHLYKGFTILENSALNLAGLALVGVALIPMEPLDADAHSKFTLHGTFAIIFFLSIAYVCVFRASDTLQMIKDQNKVKRYKNCYRWLGLGMIASPAIAFLLIQFLQSESETASWVFFVEAVGVIVFGTYWIIKSREIVLTNSERRALVGKLCTRQIHVKDAFSHVSVNEME